MNEGTQNREVANQGRRALRQCSWIVAGVLALVLAGSATAAPRVLSSRYSVQRDTGVAHVVDDNGDHWRLRYRDNAIGLGTPGKFDPGIDYVTGVLRIGKLRFDLRRFFMQKR